jgi:hypothetical protein
MNLKLIAPIVTLASAFVLDPTSYGGSHFRLPDWQAFGCRDDTQVRSHCPGRARSPQRQQGLDDCRTAVHSQANDLTVKIALDGIIYNPRSSGDSWARISRR